MLFNQAKKIISQHKKDLLRLGVRALALFGSVARNEGSRKSDVDVLIDFDPKKDFLTSLISKATWKSFLIVKLI